MQTVMRDLPNVKIWALADVTNNYLSDTKCQLFFLYNFSSCNIREIIEYALEKKLGFIFLNYHNFFQRTVLTKLCFNISQEHAPLYKSPFSQ